MPNPIVRDSRLLSTGHQLLYSFYHQADREGPQTPLIIGLHPGWGGQLPSPHYGELFLSSMFIPAFGQTGATIVSPDCPGGAWNNPDSRLAILELFDHLIDRFRIDPKQISIVGYSAGGWGAWYLLLESAERFASAIMVATLPVIDPVDRFEENFLKCDDLLESRLDEWIGRVPDLPIYMIHSQHDELLPYENARIGYQALVGIGRRVELHLVRGAGHFAGESYVQALRTSVPWLIDTWQPEVQT